MRPLALAPLALLALLTTACNDCDFFSRCDGDILEVCGEGHDQQVGRTVHRTPCAAPNGTCVERGDDAWCVTAPATQCDPGAYANTCEEDMQQSCPDHIGYVIATDCAATDRACRDGACVSP